MQSHFRDSYAGDEPEMVMHEYAVEAVVDDDRIRRIEVDPRVLPWEACPGAVASAQGSWASPSTTWPAWPAPSWSACRRAPT